MDRGSRGQSDTVGVVVLTAVFVVLSVMVGVFLLSNFDRTGETGETVDVYSEINGQNVSIEHRGGSSYAASDIRIVIQNQSSGNLQYSLTSFSLGSDSDATTFAPGDRWEKSIAELDGEIQLLVVDDGSGEVIHDETYVVA